MGVGSDWKNWVKSYDKISQTSYLDLDFDLKEDINYHCS